MDGHNPRRALLLSTKSRRATEQIMYKHSLFVTAFICLGCTGSTTTGERPEPPPQPNQKKLKSDAPMGEIPEPAKTGTVEGMVKFNGAPLTAGIVAFRVGKLKPYTAMLGADGGFKFSDLPLGEYAVTVIESAASTIKDEPAKKFAIKIPAKYASPETSGLKYDVREGKQVFDIELHE
jgi:hypothetical protein